jgi:two-component system, cell cycle sensor histidine kinase and response regulator CckA
MTNKKHIVLVDDDTTQLRVLSALLEKAGHVAHPFATVAEALTTLTTDHTPDLIITDLYMPTIDGWRFCRLLRSSEYPAYNSVPIIVVSATYSGADAERITTELGANAFVPLPADGGTFLEQVRLTLAGEKMRIPTEVLVVDDSEMQTLLIQRALIANGYHVRTAQTVAEGRAAFREKPPQIAILDYHLPDGTGDILLEEFKTTRPGMICVMITTDPTPELAVQWMQKGAAAYIRKPFDPDYLLTVCDQARRAHAQLMIEDLLEVRTQQLRESEGQKNAILNGITTNIALVDKDLNILWTNRTAAQSANRTQQEMIGHTCHGFWADPARPCENCPTLRVFQTKRSEHSIMYTPDGKAWDEAGEPVFDAQGNVIAVVEIAQDITERKRAEEELQFRNVLLSTQQEASIDAILVVDEKDNILSYNRRFIELWRLPAKLVDENVDQPVLEFVATQVADPASFSQRVQHLYDHRHEIGQDEIALADGRVIERYSASMFGPDERYYGRIWYFRDITQRKRAEDVVRQEQMINKAIIDSIPGTFYMLDAEGRYVRWNSYQRDQIIGKPEDQVSGTSAIDTIHPDDRALIQAKITQVLEGNSNDEIVEGRVLMRGGPDFKWLLMTGSKMTIDGSPFLVGIGIDITEDKKSEAKLRATMEELQLSNRLMAGREQRVLELKKEINDLLTELGRPARFRTT